MKGLVAIGLTVIGTACTPKRIDASDAGAVMAAASASSASAENAGAPPKANPLEAELLALAKRWNDALAKHDATSLASVYGANVRLYTNTVSRDAAVETKAAALASVKDYTQSISAVEIDARKSDRPRAVFEKKWTQNGKASSVRASLVFAKERGKWVVVEESDAPSDERRARASASKESCEGLVVSVVSSVPDVAKFLSGPTDPAHGHPSNGLRIGGGPPEQPTYAVAMHEDHDDHLVTFGWYDVDPKTGAVKSEADDAPQKADPALVEKMKAACAGK